MRAIDCARRIGQDLANRNGYAYVIWGIGWRTVLQPEGIEVPGGMVLEYVNPKQEKEEPCESRN